MNEKCNIHRYFEVTAKIREDLTAEDRQEIMTYRNLWMGKFQLSQTEEDIYYSSTKDNKEFGSVYFFYLKMKEKTQYFYQLSYADYLDDEYSIAVNSGIAVAV